MRSKNKNDIIAPMCGSDYTITKEQHKKLLSGLPDGKNVQTMSIKEIIESKEFQTELLKSIDSAKSQEWGYDGENEYSYESFDSDLALKYVNETLIKFLTVKQ